jgi:FAD/FMN-containing dehydrogenase
MVNLEAVTRDASDDLLGDAAITDFKARLRGMVIQPDDDGYEQARKVWNGNINRHPALIVQCAGVADVIDAVNFARDNGLLVAVRGGAHSAAGYGTCDGGIVIDLSPMRGIRVDPVNKTARADAGVLWKELDRETQSFGLATTGGVVSNTGIAGLTLGGGLGWLMGKHGCSIDNLLSVDVVTADGQFLTASEHDNADLFWGVRGGGGNFGVVTSFEYRLHPVGPIILGGLVLHPLAHAREVLRFYREFSSTLPDEAEAYAALLTSPEGAPMVALILGYNGPIDEGEQVLAPARTFGEPILDAVGPMPYLVRQAMLDEPHAIHGIERYWKSGFATEFSDELLDVVVDGASSFISPLTAIMFFRLHGASSRVGASETAFGLRGDRWDVNVISQWTDSGDSDRQIAWTRALWGRIEPLISPNAYINHIAGDDKPEKVRASYGENYDRLVALKTRYDPTNLFQLNPNIRPQGGQAPRD